MRIMPHRNANESNGSGANLDPKGPRRHKPQRCGLKLENYPSNGRSEWCLKERSSIDISKRIANAVDAVNRGGHPQDPLLPPELSRLASAVGSAQKRAGSIIEAAMIAALNEGGYTVFSRAPIPIYRVATSLISLRIADQIDGFKPSATATVEKVVQVDVIAVSKDWSKAFAIECKRGGGSTEARKRAPIAINLANAALNIKPWLEAEHGIKVPLVRPIILDWLGNSGFSSEICIAGVHSDRFFGVPIAEPITNAMESYAKQLDPIFNELITGLFRVRGAEYTGLSRGE